MLIQITNRCQEGCEHCMQNSLPNGPHMDESTFRRALMFGKFLNARLYILTGGEPTEHPQFFEFCRMLDRHLSKCKDKCFFSVTSNGMWFPELKDKVATLSKLPTFAGMQVYTNPKWYKNADHIIANQKEIGKIEGVVVDTVDEIRSMQDLGRARFSEKAQKEVAENRYYMSCLNGHLLFKQMNTIHRMKDVLAENMMCKPLVDFKGDVHLSESCFCPSFGNVNTDMMTAIFNALQRGTPCCKCKLGQKFLESNEPRILKAKEIIGES